MGIDTNFYKKLQIHGFAVRHNASFYIQADLVAIRRNSRDIWRLKGH